MSGDRTFPNAHRDIPRDVIFGVAQQRIVLHHSNIVVVVIDCWRVAPAGLSFTLTWFLSPALTAVEPEVAPMEFRGPRHRAYQATPVHVEVRGSDYVAVLDEPATASLECVGATGRDGWYEATYWLSPLPSLADPVSIHVRFEPYEIDAVTELDVGALSHAATEAIALDWDREPSS